LYVQAIEENQGIKIACLEEIAYRKGFLTREEIIKNAAPYKQNDYYSYVLKCVNG
jgi:glucose-1-phosphate thymidylyltransferase